MILELAKPRDLDSVNALALQVHELHVAWQPGFYEHTQMLYDEERFRRALEEKTMYVARQDDQVIAYVTLPVVEVKLNGLKPSKTMKIEELCVADGYRHQGIGKQIMEDVKEIAKSMDCTDIRLTCAPQNESAIGLYTGAGMEIKNLQYVLVL